VLGRDWLARQWHARGQGFKSPQLHPRSTALSAADRPRIARLGQQIGRCSASPVDLWARGIVPDHEALVRFFAEWQAWERQEIAVDRIPTVLERRTYSGADLLARYQEWQAQRGSCRIDRQRHDQFQTLLLPERWSWLVALGPGFEIFSSSSTPSATPATRRGSAPTLPGTEAQRPGRRSRPT
jgi:hypothetical protein